MKKIAALIITALLLCASCNSNDVKQEQTGDSIPESSTIAQNSDATMPPLSSSTTDEEQEPSMVSDDFAAIRAKVPYEGLRLDNEVFNIFSDAYSSYSDSELSPFIDNNNEIGKRIEQYVNAIEIGEQEVLYRHDLSAADVTYPAIRATTIYSSSSDWDNRYICQPELEPIRAARCYARGYEYDFLFCLKDHVEESIQLLYGEDMVPEILPVDFGNIRYDEITGIYEYLARGGGVHLLLSFSAMRIWGIATVRGSPMFRKT